MKLETSQHKESPNDDAALHDLCELIVDCPHSTPEWTDQGVLVLRSQNIRDGRLNLSGRSYTDEAHYKQRSRRAEIQEGDIIITREAPMGEVCMIPPNLRCCLGQRMVLLRPDTETVNARFLLYALQSPQVQNQISWSEGTGSTVSNLRIPHLEALRIPSFGMDEQRAIAGVLGSLDDKIEQNRRTAGKLEELARAVFRAWFVDFAPAHAKANGATTYPGLPQQAFDALPTTFTPGTNSPLGPIPDGWEVKPLDKVAEFLNGLALQKYPPREDGTDLPVIKIAQLRKGSTEGAGAANDSIAEKYKIKDRDILFSWSGTLEAVFWFGGPGALNQHLFKVTSEDYPDWLVYEWIHQHLEEFRLIASSKATTMGHIKRGHLSQALVATPPVDFLREADKVMRPVFDLHANANLESRKLAELRDYLLPRLLSGAVRVREEVCK